MSQRLSNTNARKLDLDLYVEVTTSERNDKSSPLWTADEIVFALVISCLFSLPEVSLVIRQLNDSKSPIV